MAADPVLANLPQLAAPPEEWESGSVSGFAVAPDLVLSSVSELDLEVESLAREQETAARQIVSLLG